MAVSSLQSLNISGDIDKNVEIKEEYTSLEKILQPLIFCMKMFGLYHNATATSEVSPEGVKRNRTGRVSKKSIPLLYCAVITIVLIFNFLRCIPAFWVGFDFVSGLNVIRILCTCWFLQCAINATIMFMACQKNDHLHKFFQFYDKILTDEIVERLQLKTNCRNFKSFVYVCTGIVVTFLIIGGIFSLILLFSEFLPDMEIAMTSPFPQYLFVKILCALLVLYCNAAWMPPMCFFFILALVFRGQFRNLNEHLQKVIIKDGINAMSTINDIRVKHHQFTKALRILDQDVGKNLLGMFATGIGISCFILYQYINDKSLDSFKLFLYTFWISTNFFFLTIFSVAAALVNKEAHSALDHIYDVDVSGANKEEIAIINLFCFKLNGPAIGFTTMDIVTVTKELLLAILGIFATYFFLLLQFRV